MTKALITIIFLRLLLKKAVCRPQRGYSRASGMSCSSISPVFPPFCLEFHYSCHYSRSSLFQKASISKKLPSCESHYQCHYLITCDGFRASRVYRYQKFKKGKWGQIYFASNFYKAYTERKNQH